MLTSLAFSYPSINAVEIHTDKQNHVSSGVPRKLGYVHSGELPKRPEAPCETGVQDRWRMTRSAWFAGS
jgi:RimJ/RimL family protein N-acetyltransferase